MWTESETDYEYKKTAQFLLVRKQTSANRPRGTLVTKPQNVNSEVHKEEMLLNKALPAIYQKNKWPTRGSTTSNLDVCLTTVIIQEDNAKPHKASISDAVEAAAREGWNISVKTQPPKNSPDLNIMDLGF